MSRLGAVIWTGDIPVSWDSLANQPGYVLNWHMAGAGFITCDTGKQHIWDVDLFFFSFSFLFLFLLSLSLSLSSLFFFFFPCVRVIGFVCDCSVVLTYLFVIQ